MTPEQIETFKQQNFTAYREIIDKDLYRIGCIDVPPRLVFDIGANVGIFTVAVKERWPGATVIAVEPHPENFRLLSRIVDELPGEVVTIQAALAKSTVYFQEGQSSGTHKFRSDSIPGELHEYVPTATPFVMLDGLAEDFGQPDFVKIDIEGGEAVMLDHEPSRLVLATTDTVAMEFHPDHWGKHAGAGVAAAMARWLGGFWETHDIETLGRDTRINIVWMKKKK